MLYAVKWLANGIAKVDADSEAEARQKIENMLLVGSIESELVELGDCYPTVESVIAAEPPTKADEFEAK